MQGRSQTQKATLYDILEKQMRGCQELGVSKGDHYKGA